MALSHFTGEQHSENFEKIIQLTEYIELFGSDK